MFAYPWRGRRELRGGSSLGTSTGQSEHRGQALSAVFRGLPCLSRIETRGRKEQSRNLALTLV